MNNLTSSNGQTTSSAVDQITRNRIATWITLGGMAVVTILGIVVVILAGPKRDEATHFVFSSLLPLIGTWVGTVLAFYFAKANFESATRSTKELLGLDERLRSISVESIMLKISDPNVTKRLLGANEDPDSLKLVELLDLMANKERNRLPVLKADGSALFIIHLSALTEFITEQALNPVSPPVPVSDLTIGDLKVGNADLYQQIRAWVCVKASASLADAKLAMVTTPGCADVFVTASGRPSEPVLGWITNVEIGLQSRA